MACVLLASCIVVIALLSRTFLFLLPSFVLCHHQSLEAPNAQRLPFTTLGAGLAIPSTSCQDPKRPTEPACQRDGLTRRSDTKPDSDQPPSQVRSLALLASPLPGAIVTSHRLHWLQMLLHTHYTRSLHAVYKVAQGTSRNRRSSRLIQIKVPSSISWLWPSTIDPDLCLVTAKKALISAAQHPGSPIPSYNRDYSLSLLRLLLLVTALLLYAVTIIVAAPVVADCCRRRCVVTTVPVKLSDAVWLARSFEAC
ncbi:hypothetical protein GE21DRAFT_1354826 [Neurospora crassa]|nr:hypothetical protein GE21DRAFT_1354826 [Neurospora crassa]